jgi:hypothetical protein
LRYGRGYYPASIRHLFRQPIPSFDNGIEATEKTAKAHGIGTLRVFSALCDSLLQNSGETHAGLSLHFAHSRGKMFV